MSMPNRIRRATVEATEEEVAKALSRDLADRNADLISFVSLLDGIDGNYSIFLDAPWGAGKTFFVKQAAAILRDGNKWIRTERAAGLELAEAANLEYLHLPVYFNAWECDYRDEPVASLVETLVDGFSDLKGDEKIDAEVKEAGRSVIDAVELSIGPVHLSLGKLANDMASEDLTAHLRRDRLIRERVISMLDKAVVERAERIVLFVDELDRCRPTYAIRLLEAIKFMFDHERLTVVFSVDLPMLAQAVKGCYGPGFDGEAYLTRFYDRYLKLPDINPDERMILDGYWKRGDSLLWETARGVIRQGVMSLRDQLKFTSLLESYGMDGAANESQARSGSTYVRNVIGPLLLCCQFSDSNLLREFLTGNAGAFERFWHKFEEVLAFSRMTTLLCQGARAQGAVSCETSASAFVTWICPEMLGMVSGGGNARVLDSSMGSIDEDFHAVLHKLHIG